MDEKEFFRAVKKEAENIKKFATTEEISNLNFDNFCGHDSTRCYYGLMTGDCRGERAKFLIKNCCVVFITTETFAYRSINNFEKDEKGASLIEKRNFHWLETYSALETFGMHYNKDKQTEKVFAFIKGERKTLKLI